MNDRFPNSVLGFPIIVNEVVPEDQIIQFAGGTLVVHPLMQITLTEPDIFKRHEKRWAWIWEHRIMPLVSEANQRLESPEARRLRS